MNDAVYARNFGKGDAWVQGKIIEVLGMRNYKVQVQNFGNIIWKRHADQLMFRYHSEPITPATSTNNNVPSPGQPPTLCNDVESGQSGTLMNKVPIESKQEEYTMSPSLELSEIPPCNSQMEQPILRRSSRIIKPPNRLDL